MTGRYRAPPTGAVIVVPLDVLTAIYHRPSGETHLIASPAPEILALLSGEELDIDALLERLRAAYDLADADMAALAARLDELVAIGLVERR